MVYNFGYNGGEPWKERNLIMRAPGVPRVKVGSIPTMDGFDSRSVGYETLFIWPISAVG